MSNTELLNYRPSAPEADPEVGAGAPEPALCAVGGLIPNFDGGWCLVRPIRHECVFGFIHGAGYLCRHPEIGRIIARTQANRAGSQRIKRRTVRRRH